MGKKRRKRKDPLRKAFNKVKKVNIVNYFVEIAEMFSIAKWERVGIWSFLEIAKPITALTDREWLEYPVLKRFHDLFATVIKSDLERLVNGERFEPIPTPEKMWGSVYSFVKLTPLEKIIKWGIKRIKKKKLVDILAWLRAAAEVNPIECFSLLFDVMHKAEYEKRSYEAARDEYSYHFTRGRNQYTKGIGSRERTHQMAARRLFGRRR